MKITQTSTWSARAVKAGLFTGRRRAAVSRRHRLRPELLCLEARQLLATFFVTNPADTLTNGVPTPKTLRWAVEQANLASPSDGASAIDFRLGAGPTTIALTQGPLELGNAAVPVSIVGPGSGSLAISGDDASRIFQVDPGVQATISGLELEDGRSSFGGAINNQGNLTVLGCQFLDNTAPVVSGRR